MFDSIQMARLHSPGLRGRNDVNFVSDDENSTGCQYTTPKVFGRNDENSTGVHGSLSSSSVGTT